MSNAQKTIDMFKHVRPMEYKESKYPNAYLSLDLLTKIKSVRAYYENLEKSVERQRPETRSNQSCSKIKEFAKVKLAFRNHSVKNIAAVAMSQSKAERRSLCSPEKKVKNRRRKVPGIGDLPKLILVSPVVCKKKRVVPLVVPTGVMANNQG